MQHNNRKQNLQNFVLIFQSTIYTAVTRGKKLVIVIGQKKALAMAIKDTKSSNRYSKLKDWLAVKLYT